jgi:MFS family permease
MGVATATLSSVEPIERETIRRVAWRLIPLIMVGYFCSYLDRSNVGMAAPTMTPDLGFSNAVFGFGSGLFFLGYCMTEIPSNLALNYFGARRWLARILITWGIISGLTAFVWNDWSFYLVRFFLGIAEAGFYPGICLYLIWWFPSYYRGRMMALFTGSGTISLFIGPPIGGLLLYLDGLAGLHGWQWLFIVEAVPPVIMCFVVWHLLTDRPKDATWLRPDQKAWLIERLASEDAQREAIHKFTLGQMFAYPKMWLLALAYFGYNSAGYGLTFFLPLIVKGLGVSTGWIGVVSALPFLCGFIAMLCWSYHSDITGERLWHVIGACLLCAAGLATSIFIGLGHPVITMLALILAGVGSTCTPAVFWTLPSAILTGTAAAGGLAMIGAIGNLGGWLGPSVYGLVKDATGSTEIGLLCLAAAPIISTIALLIAGHDSRLERIPTRTRRAPSRDAP